MWDNMRASDACGTSGQLIIQRATAEECDHEQGTVVTCTRIANVAQTANGAILLAAALSACSATSQGQVAMQQETPTGQTAPTGAAQFLGSDASLLQPGAEGQAAYVYINPNVQ
jgi:hypothetical protein